MYKNNTLNFFDIYKKQFTIGFIFLFSFIRLYITKNNYIIPLNSPHDEYWYINNAINFIWSGSYDQMAFVHLPIYSAWLILLNFLSIPSRIGIDLAWIISGMYLTYALIKFSNNLFYGLIFFIILIFHPYTFTYFDRALSENFLTILSAAIIGSIIELLNTKNKKSYRVWIAYFIYTLGIGLAFHVRKEGVVLLPPLIILLFAILFFKNSFSCIKDNIKKLTTLFVLPLASILFIGCILSLLNFLNYGIFVRYELLAPGYQRALASLNSIDAGTTPKHMTVTNNVLELAYGVSPTLLELKPYMDEGKGRMWTGISENLTGVSGGIANGWFYWAFRDIAAEAGWHKDAKYADAQYTKIADEIERAEYEGKIKKRTVIFSSFLDPDIKKWIFNLPLSTYKLVDLIIYPKINYLEFLKPTANNQQLENYKKLTKSSYLESKNKKISGVHGWIKADSAGYKIGIGDVPETASWVYLGDSRLDVGGAKGFNILNKSGAYLNKIFIKRNDGKIGIIYLNNLREQNSFISSGDLKIQIGVDKLEYSLFDGDEKWLDLLCTFYRIVGSISIIFLIASTAVLVLSKKIFIENNIKILHLILILLIISRIIVFALIDASSYNAVQARYILPIIPEYICLIFTGIYIVRVFIKKQEIR